MTGPRGTAGHDETFSDLALAEDALWARLNRAVRDRRSPWHTPVVATTGHDGRPRARVMVLRGVDRTDGLLRFHTDSRAAKVAEVVRMPGVALLFYDAGAKLQLRIEGEGRIEAQGPVADAAWAVTRPFSRRCYLAPVGPGSTACGPTSGLPPALEEAEPSLAESEAGRAHFAVLLVSARALEFLWLAVTGHRRGRFERVEGGWAGRWLVP